jgi:hypothetical protein
MEHEQAYEISTALHALYRRYVAQELLGYNLYRYKFFIDTSPRGRNCKYARACLSLHIADGEAAKLRDFLSSLQPTPPNLSQLMEALNED